MQIVTPTYGPPHSMKYILTKKNFVSTIRLSCFALVGGRRIWKCYLASIEKVHSTHPSGILCNACCLELALPLSTLSTLSTSKSRVLTGRGGYPGRNSPLSV